MPKLTYQGRDLTAEAVVENNQLVRIIINDGGLEFPFISVERAADFLVGEYGGTIEGAIEAITSTCDLTSVDTSSVPVTMKPETKKSRSTKAPKVKKEKAPKVKKEKAPKPAPVKMTFTIGGKEVEKTVQVKTILPGQVPEKTEDIDLDDRYHLHIDVYSKKNRTSKLTDKLTNETIIENVSLMDVIYKYAELAGMTFPQADKYIKIKRGLIPEPVPKSAKKETKAKKEKTAEKENKANETKPEDAVEATVE